MLQGAVFYSCSSHFLQYIVKYNKKTQVLRNLKYKSKIRQTDISRKEKASVQYKKEVLFFEKLTYNSR